MATTTPGGRYRLSDGRLVNANGQPIEAKNPKAAPVGDETEGDNAETQPESERPTKPRRGK